MLDQVDPDTGEQLGAFGVYNDDDGKYKKICGEAECLIPNAMYLMKANAAINTTLYAYTQNQLTSNKLRFLIDDSTAKNKLMSMDQATRMSAARRADWMRPYVATSVLEDQMLNLIEENEGVNIILKQVTRTIKKDKFSALIYALAWPQMEEERRGRKRLGGDISKLMLFSRH